MRTHRLAVIALALTGLLLAGCGSDDDTDTEETTSQETSSPDTDESPSGDSVGTDDFTFVAPEGWEDVSDSPAAAQAVIAVADTSGSSAFANNINVIKTGQTGLSTDDFEAAAIAELEGAGFEDVTVQDRYEIDGQEVPVVTATTTQNGQQYFTRQYYAEHDDSNYVITFSFGSQTDEDEMVDISETVIDSWRWTT